MCDLLPPLHTPQESRNSPSLVAVSRGLHGMKPASPKLRGEPFESQYGELSWLVCK